jgi:hypothetical protein
MVAALIAIKNALAKLAPKRVVTAAHAPTVNLYLSIPVMLSLDLLLPSLPLESLLTSVLDIQACFTLLR